MAITPEAALAQSPAAQLTLNDLEVVTALEGLIDAHLLGTDAKGPRSVDAPPGWDGSFLMLELSNLTPRIAGEIVRRYHRAGWKVDFTPVAAQTKGPRGEVVVGGLRMTLHPIWGRVGSFDETTAAAISARDTARPEAVQ